VLHVTLPPGTTHVAGSGVSVVGIVEEQTAGPPFVRATNTLPKSKRSATSDIEPRAYVVHSNCICVHMHGAYAHAQTPDMKSACVSYGHRHRDFASWLRVRASYLRMSTNASCSSHVDE